MTDDGKAGMLRAADLVFQMAVDAQTRADREGYAESRLPHEYEAMALENAAHHIKAAARRLSEKK